MTELSAAPRTSIAPWLSVPDATQALDFYKKAFDAVEVERLENDQGGVEVARLVIGEAAFWVQQDAESSPSALGGRSAVRLILTVADPDAVAARAIAAGATLIAPVGEGNGWRVGRIADPSGHHWEIGRPLAAG